MLVEFHCHSHVNFPPPPPPHTHTQATALYCIRKLKILRLLSLHALHFAVVQCVQYLTHAITQTLSFELRFLRQEKRSVFWSTCKCSSFPATLLQHRRFLAVIFSSALLTVERGNLYNGRLVKLSWCHDLLL
jgi:hypothetical protein